MNEDLRKRLAEKQGNSGQSQFPKYLVPIINFNGNTGEYRLTPLEDGELAKEAVPLKSPVGIVILKKRSALATKLDDEPSYFSSEFTSPNDSTALFSKNGGRASFVTSAKATELRVKFPNLKTKSILYCLYEGQVHKLEVKGASLTNFFEWQDEMKKEDKHSFEVTVNLGSAKEKHTTSKKTYFVMTFKSVELENFDGMEEAMDEVNAALKLQDEYQATRNAATPSQAAASGMSAEANKLWNGADETPKADDINPDDIPF